MEIRRINPVYKAINRPLTILGAERRLFFLSLVMGAAMFNLFGSLLGGVLMFTTLFLLAQWATHSDPEILRILLSAGKFKTQYDAAKFVAVKVQTRRSAGA